MTVMRFAFSNVNTQIKSIFIEFFYKRDCEGLCVAMRLSFKTGKYICVYVFGIKYFALCSTFQQNFLSKKKGEKAEHFTLIFHIGDGNKVKSFVQIKIFK